MTSSLLDVRHGSRTPRVCSFPPAATSAGHEAIELARSAGLYLDPWQQDVLIASLGEGASGLWAAPDVGLVVPRQNGKGTILEARELAGLFLFGESILHTSHEFKTSMDHYRRLERLVRNTPDLHRKVEAYPKAPGTEGIVMRDGRALRFMARTKGSGRGFPADVVIIDEAFAATDEQLAALMPTMQSKPNPQTWYTSSPPLDGISGEPLFAMRARGEAGADDLAWFDWGAELGVDADDREQWWATNPAMGYRLTEKGMSLMRAKLSAVDFSRECLGVWPRTAAERWAVISEADWLARLDETSNARDPLVFSIDVTPERSHATIAAAGYRVDGDVHGEVVDHGQGTSWLAARAVELNQRWKPAAWVIDPGGAAGFLIPSLEAEGLTVVTLSSRQVGQAFGMFRAAASSTEQVAAPESEPALTGTPGEADVELKAPKLWVRLGRHGGALTSAVEGAAIRRVGDGTSWDRKTTETVISPLVSLTNAVFGLLTRPVEESSEPWVMYG